MDRKLIRIGADDLNLTEVEGNILIQTAGDTDLILDIPAMDTLIQKYLESQGWESMEIDKLGCCGDEDCEGCSDDVERQVW